MAELRRPLGSAQSGPLNLTAPVFIERLLVDLKDLAHGAVPAEVPVDALGRRSAETRPKHRIAQEPQHSLDETAASIGLRQEARASARHHLGERGAPEG